MLEVKLLLETKDIVNTLSAMHSLYNDYHTEDKK